MKKSIEFCWALHVLTICIAQTARGKHIYNLGLSECKNRLNRLRADKEYQAILALRRDLKKMKLATKQVDQLRRDIVIKRHFLTKTDIEKYVKDNAGYLRDGFNYHFAQTLATVHSKPFREFSMVNPRESGSRVNGTIFLHLSMPRGQLPVCCVTPTQSQNKAYNKIDSRRDCGQLRGFKVRLLNTMGIAEKATGSV